MSESRRTSHSSLFSANRGPRARSESFASTVILVSEAEADRRLSVGNESLGNNLHNTRYVELYNFECRYFFWGWYKNIPVR